jgi:hypothetical protein
MARVKVTFGEHSFFVMDGEFGINTNYDQSGMPVNGTISTSVAFCVDLHDTKNFSFSTLKALFDYANVPTRDKIQAFKVEFLKDDDIKKNDVICSFHGKGWISSFRTSNVGGENNTRNHNHLLHVVVKPALSEGMAQDITLGN